MIPVMIPLDQAVVARLESHERFEVLVDPDGLRIRRERSISKRFAADFIFSNAHTVNGPLTRPS